MSSPLWEETHPHPTVKCDECGAAWWWDERWEVLFGGCYDPNRVMRSVCQGQPIPYNYLRVGTV